MSENNGLYGIGKYDSRRDEILHSLCLAGWSNDSFGDVEAPTGYVWRIANTWEDVRPINTEFNSLFEALEIPGMEDGLSPMNRRILVGHFIVIEDSNGFIYVRSFNSEGAMMQEYEYRELQYSEWLGDGDDD